MRLEEGKKLFIRSLITVAGEVIPFFWPMRNFIHHNPLYGLERLPFKEAVKLGSRLFHARGYLSREAYRRFLERGDIKKELLIKHLREFLKERNFEREQYERLLSTLMMEADLKPSLNLYLNCKCPTAKEIAKHLEEEIDPAEEVKKLSQKLGREMTLYDFIDQTFGTRIGETLNELMARNCAEFLDEGQAVWGMPFRERGFYKAWREVAKRSRRLKLKGCCGLENVLESCEEPEEAVAFALGAMGIPEDLWDEYVTTELSKLHGWTGFIRWRSNTKDYYWQIKHPADLVDYLAIRLLLALSLLREEEKNLPFTPELSSIREFIEKNPEGVLIRKDYFSGKVPPHLAQEVYESIELDRLNSISRRYFEEKKKAEALSTASFITQLWKEAGLEEEKLLSMDKAELLELGKLLRDFEEEEGYIWLKAHEDTLIERLVAGIEAETPDTEDRPFAQALFCIDVRSERFRRNLENLGRYETYGIAGFFGVPISFIELGKGHETHLCPVLIKPKNVVLELHKDLKEEKENLYEVVKEIIHDLKYNVFTPYITVEAIGLLFGFDMIGKTFFPLGYGAFRHRLANHKPPSKLMIDKPTKEYVLEVIGILQREIISRAVKNHLGKEEVPERILEALRKLALEEERNLEGVAREMNLSTQELENFIETLRRDYRIERGYTRIQIEKLAKIGFTLEEQVFFVERALHSIGLTKNFGKLVLVIGHGSRSENNPYESALDCGACGGDHGAVNAKVFAMMANKKEVRERLREKGIDIPEDTLFVACEHNTTTDEVEFFDLDQIPATHLPFIQKAMEDLKEAGKKTALERCMELGNDCKDPERAFVEVRKNSLDWTQVRPEWGLSGNYAFIIGGRHLTRRLNLEGKAFLHSYDWRIDPKGYMLEIILSGPLVVGEWINMEHYFSAVDNEHYGSGSKVYHNVVGRIGVMSGNLSDLRTGLPAQTVLKGKHPHHNPVRLITVVEAPLGRVKKVISGIGKIRELVQNHWINLIVFDPEERKFYRYLEGRWVSPSYEEVSQ
ncbi:MAG: DUF2309 domain-containing protein [Aquificae bacterium]|nr:DUF2309 domain-containing protein [Aquificota bacterium]